MEPGGPKSESRPEHHYSKEEMKIATESFEKLSQRLNELWTREEPLTAQEQKEVDLILNNTMILQEKLDGMIPEELKDAE